MTRLTFKKFLLTSVLLAGTTDSLKAACVLGTPGERLDQSISVASQKSFEYSGCGGQINTPKAKEGGNVARPGSGCFSREEQEQLWQQMQQFFANDLEMLAMVDESRETANSCAALDDGAQLRDMEDQDSAEALSPVPSHVTNGHTFIVEILKDLEQGLKSSEGVCAKWQAQKIENFLQNLTISKIEVEETVGSWCNLVVAAICGKPNASCLTQIERYMGAYLRLGLESHFYSQCSSTKKEQKDSKKQQEQCKKHLTEAFRKVFHSFDPTNLEHCSKSILSEERKEDFERWVFNKSDALGVESGDKEELKKQEREKIRREMEQLFSHDPRMQSMLRGSRKTEELLHETEMDSKVQKPLSAFERIIVKAINKFSESKGWIQNLRSGVRKRVFGSSVENPLLRSPERYVEAPSSYLSEAEAKPKSSSMVPFNSFASDQSHSQKEGFWNKVKTNVLKAKSWVKDKSKQVVKTSTAMCHKGMDMTATALKGCKPYMSEASLTNAQTQLQWIGRLLLGI